MSRRPNLFAGFLPTAWVRTRALSENQATRFSAILMVPNMLALTGYGSSESARAAFSHSDSLGSRTIRSIPLRANTSLTYAISRCTSSQEMLTAG